MPTYIMISKIPPEYCLFHGMKEDAIRIIRDYKVDVEKIMEERKKIMEKHGVKEIGAYFCCTHTQDQTMNIFEAPSGEAYEKFKTDLIFLLMKTYPFNRPPYAIPGYPDQVWIATSINEANKIFSDEASKR